MRSIFFERIKSSYEAGTQPAGWGGKNFKLKRDIKLIKVLTAVVGVPTNHKNVYLISQNITH